MDGWTDESMDGWMWVGGWMVYAQRERGGRSIRDRVDQQNAKKKNEGVCVLVAMRIKQNDKL
jgi:hypothetical protein